MDTKAAIRAELKARRLALSPEEYRGRSQRALNLLRGLDVVHDSAVCAVFVGQASAQEIDTLPFIAWLLGRGKRVLVPRVDPSAGTLSLHEITSVDDDLSPGSYGILEPANTSDPVPVAAADMVLVPGIAFDGAGNRIGYGKGYYDTLLAPIRASQPRPVLVGLGFEFQVIESFAFLLSPHDVPVDLVVTDVLIHLGVRGGPGEREFGDLFWLGDVDEI